jgi:hypothetical protein
MMVLPEAPVITGVVVGVLTAAFAMLPPSAAPPPQPETERQRARRAIKVIVHEKRMLFSFLVIGLTFSYTIKLHEMHERSV